MKEKIQQILATTLNKDRSIFDEIAAAGLIAQVLAEGLQNPNFDASFITELTKEEQQMMLFLFLGAVPLFFDDQRQV